jgi:hypothetical protein
MQLTFNIQHVVFDASFSWRPSYQVVPFNIIVKLQYYLKIIDIKSQAAYSMTAISHLGGADWTALKKTVGPNNGRNLDGWKDIFSKEVDFKRCAAIYEHLS